jgi:hypothetical protein
MIKIVLDITMFTQTYLLWEKVAHCYGDFWRLEKWADLVYNEVKSTVLQVGL